ncbi:MAG: NADH-quinone oxidoreductase subunit NuoH [Phycisphaeraceae bacterium]|nr:NADH-quinone oxidoreductase subunit NuoH [Phycisphaeraceae bacterium]
MNTTFVEWAFGNDLDFIWAFAGVAAVWALGITVWVSLVGLVSIWLERKISAHIQCRLGPMEVGPHGALQTLADGVKLLAKEDIVPDGADRFLFGLAPILAFVGSFAVFAVVPFGPDLIVADLNLGIYFLAAIGSIEAIGVIAAGWASNNKWSIFGAVRAATQVVSYEIPLSLSLVTVAALAGSLSMMDIVHAQGGWMWNWFLFRNPFMVISFIIFYIASLAECKRAPFDLPEAESELVSGFHTEYSGMRFAIFFLAEYAAMYVVSAVAAVLFFGGWYTGFGGFDKWLAEASPFWANLLGAGVIISKAFLLICVQMWLRWTLPRIRLDQMMYLCLKVLVPIGMVVFMLAALWQGLFPVEVLGDWSVGSKFGLFWFIVVIAGTIRWVRSTIQGTKSFQNQSYLEQPGRLGHDVGVGA